MLLDNGSWNEAYGREDGSYETQYVAWKPQSIQGGK